MNEAGTGETGFTGHSNFRYTPPSDGPSPLRPAQCDTCVFCGTTDTTWQHDLNASKAQWRDEHGYGMTWATSLSLCDDCETLWAQSEYWQLLQRQRGRPREGRAHTMKDQLLGIAAFARADRGPRRQS